MAHLTKSFTMRFVYKKCKKSFFAATNLVICFTVKAHFANNGFKSNILIIRLIFNHINIKIIAQKFVTYTFILSELN